MKSAEKPDKPIETLVPWGISNPLALPQQVWGRVRDALADGRTVHVMTCVIEKNERGNYEYYVSNTEMPMEVALMAAHQVKAHVLKDT